MQMYKKLILTGATAALAVVGGTGAAMAAAGGPDTGNAKAKQTASYRTPHKGTGPRDEKGWNSAKDNGKPSFRKDGTPPEHGGQPETHTFPAR